MFIEFKIGKGCNKSYWYLQDNISNINDWDRSSSSSSWENIKRGENTESWRRWVPPQEGLFDCQKCICFCQEIRLQSIFPRDIHFPLYYWYIYHHVAAYFIIELSYEHSRYLEKIVKLKLKNPNTLPQMFLFLSLYLIYWNVIAHFLKKRALTPPVKSDEYEEIQESDKAPPVLEPLPNG